MHRSRPALSRTGAPGPVFAPELRLRDRSMVDACRVSWWRSRQKSGGFLV